MRTTLQLLSFLVACAGLAQDFNRASYLGFEYIPGRRGKGYILKGSQPLEPAPFLDALSKADRLAGESCQSGPVIAEADLTIDREHYRLFFPALPAQEAAYTFAIAPAKQRTNRTYFRVPPERYSDFAAVFRQVLDENSWPSRPGSH